MNLFYLVAATAVGTDFPAEIIKLFSMFQMVVE